MLSRDACFLCLFRFFCPRYTAFSPLLSVPAFIRRCGVCAYLCKIIILGKAARPDLFILYYLAVIHRELAGHIRLSLLIVMRNDDDKLISRHFGKCLHDALSRSTVEIARRLIRNDYRRIFRKCARDGNSLLLAPGQLRDFCAAVLAEPYQIDQLEYPVSALSAPLSG